jgi:hypothetical protein
MKIATTNSRVIVSIADITKIITVPISLDSSIISGTLVD